MENETNQPLVRGQFVLLQIRCRVLIPTHAALNRLTGAVGASYTWRECGDFACDGAFIRRPGYSISVTAYVLLSI